MSTCVVGVGARRRWLAAGLGMLGFFGCSAVATADVEFKVSFANTVRERPATGRVIVYLVKANSPIDLSGAQPGDGPFFESPQPMFGIDVTDLGAGMVARVNDDATCFPVKPSALPPGRYKVQAVLDVGRHNSSWRREPGNLHSQTQMIEIKAGAGGADGTFEIPLTEVVEQQTPATTRGVEWFEVRSELLSKFRGHDVVLRAGVVLPTGFDKNAKKRYAAVYEIPGFGGDHQTARMTAGRRGSSGPGGGLGELLKHAFWITLDPEGPNGHHLFANSDNNGPVGDALVTELIPALEARYPLIAESGARLLRGHSSGGWSSLWLALAYPKTFGGAWSTSPDPVDFVHFQLPNIYADASMYTRARTGGGGASRGADEDVPSYRDTGDTRMTIRQENLMEEVLGPKNSSGQQWDSWLAVFGPRGKDGNPAVLYDPVTGKLDHAIAATFKRFDVTDLVRTKPETYVPILKQRVRIVVGDQDNYFLNEAVASLKKELEKPTRVPLPEGEHGYIKIVPGRDHGSIMAAEELRAIPGEMLEQIRRAGAAK